MTSNGWHTYRWPLTPPTAAVLQTYPHIGKLVGGAFYDLEGRPTAALQQVEAKAEEGRRIAAEREAEEHKFPACNSKWTAAEGRY